MKNSNIALHATGRDALEARIGLRVAARLSQRADELPADIGERLMLGLLTLAKAGEAIAARREEKRGLVAALLAAGLISSAPREDAP